MYLTLAEAKEKLIVNEDQLLEFIRSGMLQPYFCTINNGFCEDDNAIKTADFILGSPYFEEDILQVCTREEAHMDWRFLASDCDRAIIRLKDKPDKKINDMRAKLILEAIHDLGYVKEAVENKGKVRDWCIEHHSDLIQNESQFRAGWLYGNKEKLWAIKPEKNKSKK